MPTTKFKLANILLSDDEQFLYAPALLVRSKAPWHRSTAGAAQNNVESAKETTIDVANNMSADDTWTFLPGEHDFTTFFNALSVAKWKEYTVAREFHLSFEVRGAAFTVVQTRADGFSWETEPVEGTARRIDATEQWTRVDVPMLAATADVIEGFLLCVEDTSQCHPEGAQRPKDPSQPTVTTPAALEFRHGFYYAVVEEADIRPVELALCTTTFRKEAYIERNIALVKERILASSEPIAKHFTQHVVDNGRTLDVQKLADDPKAKGRVHIYPNDNVGGSGGYARGMIEAMRQEPKATHVLLMDDDVLIAPESIIRTYNLLSLVDRAHKDHFVSGAMMDLFEPDVRWEDTGYVTEYGDCVPLKPDVHIGLLHNVVVNEIYASREKEKLFRDQAQAYAGWWYCVIPMQAIEQNGLPLPVFVRYDDIEYALRCHAKFLTMNGICLWHPSFVRRYNAAVERYQVTRNAFIGQFTCGMAPMADFVDKTFHMIQLELKKFNYTNAELALEGFEDFLKGPEFIMRRGQGEKSFMAANRNAEKLIPMDELRAQAQSEGISLATVFDVDSQKESNIIERRSYPERIQDYLTFNGQRIDLGYVQEDTVAIIDVAGWLYPSDQIRRKDTIVAVDLENKRGVIRHLDRKKFQEIWARWKRDLKTYNAKKEHLQAEYAAQRERMTSVEFWKEYLGIE